MTNIFSDFATALIFIQVISGFVVGSIFESKRRNFGSGFVVGLILGVVGIAVSLCLRTLIFSPDLSEEEILCNKLSLLDRLLLHNVITEEEYKKRQREIYLQNTGVSNNLAQLIKEYNAN